MGYQPLLFNGFTIGGGGGGGSGTVTSVGLAAPSFLTVTGSPVTTSGTLTLTLASQTANKVLAAPNGAPGTPTFRVLVAADIPALPYANVNLSNLTSPTAINQDLLPGSDDAFALGNSTHRWAQGYFSGGVILTGSITGRVQLLAPPNGTSYGLSLPGDGGTNGQVLTSNGIGGSSWTSVTSGTVTSVALADTTGLFNITGSPVTTSGTLTLASFQSQAQHSFFAGPSGSAGAPTFRAIVASDVPTLNQNTTGSAATLTTPRTINGVSFDGSGNITVTAAAGTLTGTTLNSTVVNSSLTSVGTINSGVWNGTTIAIANGGTGTSTTSQNFAFIGPISGSGAPSFRLLVAGDVPTLNQNTTGTASNITASSNSTLTTLSVLSLPASQLTGTLAAGQFPALTGDITTSAGSLVTTLVTVNSNVGSFGSSTSIPNFTVNAKGLITAAGSNVVIAPAGTLTGTTLNATVVTSSLTSLGAQSIALNMNSHKINNVTDPTSAQDAATKAYVDSVAAGINPAVAVQAATTSSSNTSTFTYNNGVSGIGATLTGPVNTSLTVDGYTFTALGQRLLVKNDTQSPSGAFNGIYYVTQLQTGILPLILTRALDYDQPSDINNTGAIPVINGTVNSTTQWVITSLVNTVGTDPLTFTQFARNPADYLLKANNLSDVSNAATSFANITQPASAVLQGSVSTAAQIFAGEKTFNNAVVGAEISTPANPSAGFDKLYFKSDKNLYSLDSSGNERLVGPGMAGSDWVLDSQITITQVGSVSNNTIYSRRVGDSLHINGRITGGTMAGNPITVNIGTYRVDSAKIGSSAHGTTVGRMQRTNAGTAQAHPATSFGPWDIFYDGSTTTDLYVGATHTSNAYDKSLANAIISNGDDLFFELVIPIAGWSANNGPGRSGFQFYSSSQVTTDSTGITSTSFATFSNANAILSFTPTVTGKYKIYSSAPINANAAGSATVHTRIFNSAGSATLLNESDAILKGDATSVSPSYNLFIQSIYTLTAGTAYSFDIQGSAVAGSTVTLTGNTTPFYIFAELVG